MFFNFDVKCCCTLKMFLISAQNNFYLLSISRRICEKKISVDFMSLVDSQASNIWMLFWKIYCGASFEIISGRLFLYFLIVFHKVWKNQESWEPRLVGFSVKRHCKMQKILGNIFLTFWSCHYGFTNSLETLSFPFSNIQSGVSACNILPYFQHVCLLTLKSNFS